MVPTELIDYHQDWPNASTRSYRMKSFLAVKRNPTLETSLSQSGPNQFFVLHSALFAELPEFDSIASSGAVAGVFLSFEYRPFQPNPSFKGLFSALLANLQIIRLSSFLLFAPVGRYRNVLTLVQVFTYIAICLRGESKPQSQVSHFCPAVALMDELLKATEIDAGSTNFRAVEISMSDVSLFACATLQLVR